MLKLFRFLKPFAPMIAGVLVLIFLQTIGDLYLPTLMADIIDQGVMMGDTGEILRIGGLMLLVSAGSVLAAIVASYLSSRVAMGFGRDVRNQVFRRVESYSLHEFDKLGTSTLITRTTNDITQVQMVTVMIMRMMIMAPLTAVGGTILALRQDQPLTLVLAVSIPVLAIVIVLIATRIIPLFRQVQVKIDKINRVLREKLTGIRVIRAFNTVDNERARFNEANVDLTGTFIKVNRIMAFMMPAIMLIMSLTSTSVLWFASVRISNDAMDLGALAAFTQYVMQIMFSMIMMAMMFIMVPRAQAAAARINEVLDTMPEIIDPDVPEDQFTGRGHVEFKNVTFRYYGAEEPALMDISFDARPGEVTAIIGSTGSGKSTLVNLIPRFYDVESGSILIDGVDIRNIRQEDLRAKIGYVPQQAVLFSGAIDDNIRFGKEDATDEQVLKAAETAQAMEFINGIDDGFSHAVAQGGTNVSGGQKQRLAIARALLKDAPILLLDEATSALDAQSEQLVQQALETLMKGRTSLVIAHRLATIRDADRILVLEGGKLIDEGTHDELVKKDGRYAELAKLQFRDMNGD